MATIALCMIVKDEESLIANAIESVKDIVDEVIVVDTGSKDKTPVIAKELGANVLHFEWNNDFSAARNFGLKNVSSDWVLVLDADEEILKEQSKKLSQIADSELDACMFMQKNFSSTQGFGFVPESRKGFKGFYPAFIIRMFRADSRIKFEGFVHETVDASLAGIKAKIGFTDVGIYHYQELKGDDAFREKQIKYAELLEQNIDRFPDKARGYHHIGVVYYRFRNDYERAVNCFERSVKLNAGNSFVFNDLAAAYVQTGKYKKALEAFGKSLQIRPEPSTFYNIGLLQEKLGNNEAAVLAYEDAVRLNHPRKKELVDKIEILSSLIDDGKSK